MGVGRWLGRTAIACPDRAHVDGGSEAAGSGRGGGVTGDLSSRGCFQMSALSVIRLESWAERWLMRWEQHSPRLVCG